MKHLLYFFTFIFSSFSLLSSELFLKINRSEKLYVQVNNHIIYNPDNVFRFFELESGFIEIDVFTQSSHVKLMTEKISIKPNQRLVAEIDYNGNLTILKTISINVQNWYTSIVDNNFNNDGFNNNSSNNSFSEFITELKKSSFDSKREEMIKKYISKTNLNASEISQILNTFDFDSTRLEVAKQCYLACSDKQNYFTWKKLFTFLSNFRSLEDFIESH